MGEVKHCSDTFLETTFEIRDNEFRTWLKNDNKLITLGMWGNSVGVEGAGPLANALRCNTTLRSLNLGDNALGNGGESLLADAVQSNSTLVNLEFYDCPSAVEQWLRH